MSTGYKYGDPAPALHSDEFAVVDVFLTQIQGGTVLHPDILLSTGLFLLEMKKLCLPEAPFVCDEAAFAAWSKRDTGFFDDCVVAAGLGAYLSIESSIIIRYISAVNGQTF